MNPNFLNNYKNYTLLVVFIIALTTALSGCEDNFKFVPSPPYPPNTEETIMDFLKQDTMMETTVQAIQLAGLEPLFSDPQAPPMTFLGLVDKAWRDDVFNRNNSKYKGKKLQDIPVDTLANFIKSITLTKVINTWETGYGVDEIVPTLNPKVVVRVRIPDNYEVNINSNMNSLAGSNGIRQYWCNHVKSNGIVHAYERFFQPLP